MLSKLKSCSARKKLDEGIQVKISSLKVRKQGIVRKKAGACEDIMT
jgi:hypothetical protein